MCISTTGTPAAAAASRAPSRRSAYTSLIIPAPASTVARITSGLEVSMLIGTDVSRASRSTSGRTRRSSSAASTSAAPGRVDSPPTSRMSAPCSSSVIAWAKAASASSWAPPSENESGVTLTMPITRGRSSTRGRPLQSRVGAVSNIQGSGKEEGQSELWPSRHCAASTASGLRDRAHDRARGRRLIGRRAGAATLVPVTRRPGLAAGHDVVDLAGVDGLVLQQGLGHDMQLVHVVLQDRRGAVIGLVKNAADHLVDLPRGLVRHALVLGDRAAQEHLVLVVGVGDRPHLVAQA